MPNFCRIPLFFALAGVTAGATFAQTNGGPADLDKFVTGGGNNGQAIAAGLAIPYGFYAAASTSTERNGPLIGDYAVGLLPHVLDNRGGMHTETFNNVHGFVPQSGVGAGRWYATMNNCFWNTYDPTGSGVALCDVLYNSHFGQGIDYGNGILNNQGWSGTRGFVMQTKSYSRGIDQNLTAAIECHKIGDCNNYLYAYSFGGWVAPSDEGIEGLKINGGQYNEVYTGVSAVSGVGLTTVRVSSCARCAYLADGGHLIDKSTVLASGNVVAVAQNGRSQILITSDTHVASTGVGILAADLVNTVHAQNGTQATFSVTMTSGTISNGVALILACDDSAEEVIPINVTGSGTLSVTAIVRNSHLAGCPVVQGGIQGSLDFTADRQFSDTIRTDYFIYGSTANTLLTKTYQPGDVVNIYPQQHDFGNVQTLGHVVRSKNIVTASFTNGAIRSGLVGNSFSITPTGATNSNFAGTFSNPTMTPTTISWAQSGADDATGSTASLMMGGSAGLRGAYTVYPSAEVIEVLTTDQQANGNARLAPNHINFHVGDRLEEPFLPTNHSQMLGFDQQATTPSPNGFNTGFAANVHGAGIDGGYFGIAYVNSTPIIQYSGHGGIGSGPTFLQAKGPWANYLQFVNAPISPAYNNSYGGVLMSVGPPVEGFNASGSSIYFPSQLQAIGNDYWYEKMDAYNRAYTFGWASSGAATVISPSGVSLPASTTVGSTEVCLVNGKNCPIVSASLTTTAATSDTLSMPGMMASGHCSVTATNGSALAATQAGVTAKTANSVTVTHATTAGMTYDILCTPY